MKEKKFQLGNVLTISTAHMLHDIFTAFLAILLPLLREKIGFSLVLAGFLPVALRFPNLINPIIGSYSDKLKLRYLVAAAPIVASISMTLLGVATNYATVVILLLIAGFGSTLIHVPSPVLIKLVSGDKKGMGMSFYMLGGELARALGPLVVTAAVSIWTLEGIWRIIPIGVCLSLLIYVKISKVEREAIPQKAGKSAETHKDIMKLMLPVFLSVAGINIFQGIMRQSLMTFLPTYMKANGSTIVMASIALSIMQFSGAIGTFTAGTISDVIGRKKALLIMAIITPILMITYTMTSGVLAIVILTFLGFFMFFANPIILAYIHDFDTSKQAFVNGVFMTISFVISSLASLVIGFLGDAIDLNTTFRIGGILAFGVIPIVLFMKEKKKI